MKQLFFLSLICKLTGAALMLQTAELILFRELVSDQGVWRWETLRNEFNALPKTLRACFELVFCYPGFLSLLTFQLFASILILFFSSPILFIPLFISAFLISIRFRGTFNGGSDYMTLMLLMSLSVASLFKEPSLMLTACLWYIAIQSCLSYFISGIVKLKNGHWRRGEALLTFLTTSNYQTPALLKKAFKSKRFSVASSWGVILFECSFPVALLNHGFCVAYIGIAFAFHLANFYIFGLNRFLFIWTATYPALLFCSGRLK
jgi:hypothetical protein